MKMSKYKEKTDIRKTCFLKKNKKLQICHQHYKKIGENFNYAISTFKKKNSFPLSVSLA